MRGLWDGWCFGFYVDGMRSLSLLMWLASKVLEGCIWSQRAAANSGLLHSIQKYSLLA